ncbi:MAG: metal-sensitive transcriptional regulator [Paracoccaceae bacterium]|nr:metal-sensitive transcriptional regulator [Paracoccaceae bacterium]MDE2675175.1 metal-sensitive transcriptional regulator [Paracoccaceae bacterium]MXZ51345.1 metal-sensitive transcriptional regulator [Paracoccaceae bacterium]MYF47019.1 metal-sensitive transcriptional regulator [Paracoccaceae bacterium]MYG10962.1 metal-sensitive transcriptional regulator [Paracoccaceae bacterium]
MHPSHKEHLGKMNRVSGQVEAIKRMIDEEKYCIDIMTQIRAARSALKSIELAILNTHMRSCLDQASRHETDGQNRKIEEIVTLLKKYE